MNAKTRNLGCVVLAGAVLLAGACRDGNKDVPPGVATIPAEDNGGIHDEHMEIFLREYVREEEMFADDNLAFAVNEGIVAVTGEVDSREELKALQPRIRRVPGVRDLNVTGIQVGSS